MTWKVNTSPAQRGSTVTLTGAQPKQTVAQLAITSDSGEAIPATFYLGTDPTAVRQGTGQSGPLTGLQTGETLQWIVEWGYGGGTFAEQIEANSGKFTKTGDWFRLTALIVGAPGAGGVNSGDAIKVRGLLVPATAADDRDDTVVGLVQSAAPPSGSLAGILQIIPPVNAGPLGVNPLTLLRLWGYNGGTTSDYVMLFDSVLQPGNGATPKYVAAYVAKQGTFSLDNSPEGLAFSNNAWIGLSSTPDTLTIDGSADFSIDWEICPIPTF
jgi:hypothetical protein